MADLYYMARMVPNAAVIAVSGILSYNRVQNDPVVRSYSISIADPFVNERRSYILVGGRPVHDYVPLYWATHTPMQYVVTVSRSVLSNEDLVFFILDSAVVLRLPGVWTTDGNAASNVTHAFPGDGAVGHVDWNIVRTRNCYSREYKRKKCAEVLVPDFIPAACFTKIAVYSRGAKERLAQAAKDVARRHDRLRVSMAPIVVDPSLYC